MTPGQSPPEPASTPAGKPRPKILMLWDDDSFPSLIAVNVRESFEVVTVHSREAALEALATKSFFAVMLNIISAIPGGGYHFIEEIQRSNNSIPVIIFTAAWSKKELGEIFCPPDSSSATSVFAIVPQPATVETMLKVFNAVVNRGVQPPSNGAAIH